MDLGAEHFQSKEKIEIPKERWDDNKRLKLICNSDEVYILHHNYSSNYITPLTLQLRLCISRSTVRKQIEAAEYQKKMVLESVMICLDNSEWMRNGDYAPTRLEAQQDAAGMICNDRTGSNPENTVGVLTMAGRGVDLLVSPTEDAGKILACFTRVKTGGKNDFSSSVQIAQLALKHRKNKNGSQRIIVFVGSPLLEETAALQKIGKQLKKNNVAVDVISFGEFNENSDKLAEFINCTNSNDNW